MYKKLKKSTTLLLVINLSIEYLYIILTGIIFCLSIEIVLYKIIDQCGKIQGIQRYFLKYIYAY